MRARGVLAAVAFSLAVGACAGGDEAPVAVARAFAGAVARGDSKAMLELIDEDAVAWLTGAAERASDQVGGRRNIEAHEMLQARQSDPGFGIAEARVLDDDGSTAHVELTGPEGQTHVLELVQQQGRWRVRLSLPGDGA